MKDKKNRVKKREEKPSGIRHKGSEVSPDRVRIIIRPAWVAAGVLGAVIIGLGVWLGYSFLE